VTHPICCRVLRPHECLENLFDVIWRLRPSALVVLVLSANSAQPTNAEPLAHARLAKLDQVALTLPPNFQDYKGHAIEYLTRLHWPHPTTMCAVEESSPDDHQIWFLWREGKQIILWDEPDLPLAASRRILRIPKDVVATPARIRGSTYKVTQAWVNELEARCKNQGITFSVKGSHPATR
jgi:hypothetical protein